MPIIDIGLISGSHKHRIRQIDSQECVNWYPEILNTLAKNPTVLMPTPGLSLYRTVSEPGRVRGLHVTADEVMYAVVGSTFVEITSSTAEYIVRGHLKSGSGQVVMADNGVTTDQMIIVDGEYGYLYNTSTDAFSEIAAFPGGSNAGSSHVVFFDGYFIANELNSGRFFFSDLYDGATWQATNFYTAEGHPDNVVAIVKTAQELWIFGKRSLEMWNSNFSGSPGASGVAITNPFARIGNAYIEVGTAAAHSPATINAHVFWLGSNLEGTNVVMHAIGFNPERISNHGVEYAISQMPRVDDAIGFCYQQEGHTFYVLTFPTGNQTWVYDLTTQAWHERTWYNEDNETVHRHRASCHALYNNKNYVGDRQNGKIYELSLDVYTDNGGKIQRVRTLPHVSAKGNRVYYQDFELDLEKGVGTVSYEKNDTSTVLAYNFASDTTVADWTGNSTLSLTDGTFGGKFKISDDGDGTNVLFYSGRDSTFNSDTVSHSFIYPSTAIYNQGMRVDSSVFIGDAADMTSAQVWFDIRKTSTSTDPYYELRLDTTRVSGDLTSSLSITQWESGVNYVKESIVLQHDYNKFHSVAFSVQGVQGETELFAKFDTTEISWTDLAISNYPSIGGNLQIGIDARMSAQTDVIALRNIDATTYYSTDYREPQAMLRWSDDGGMTFGPERWQGFGKIGEYYKTCKWRRLGTSDNRVFRLTIADPIRSALIDSHVEIEPEKF